MEKYPPVLCIEAETVAYMSNTSLRFHGSIKYHKYDDHADEVDKPNTPELQPYLSMLTFNPQLVLRNVCLIAYIDVFLYNFWV